MKLKVQKPNPNPSAYTFIPALIESLATHFHPQYHDYTPDDYEPDFFRSAAPGAFSKCFHTSTRVDLGAIKTGHQSVDCIYRGHFVHVFEPLI